ncbi:MAG: hypothetical protein R6W90_16015 [Ignavibacteriaceae bacterium]
MKTKLFYFLCLLFVSTSFPQAFDSTKTDTITFADSTTIILSDTTAADTTALFGAIADSAAVDTLVPLYQEPVSQHSYFISHDDILRTDYEYTGDMLKLYPFRFIDETAFYGQPENGSWYVNGYPEVTGYMKDKILLDSRITGQFNLNLIQSEVIDSIEIISLPRSFLYSGQVNLFMINFIEKDFISPAPYTRIKYYEGPFGQAIFDGIFNTLVFNRLNLFMDITNRKGDDSYENTAFGSWQATAKLKYIYSNNVNIIASYNYADIDAGINGGIDVDSISRITSDIEQFLYDEITAPVLSLTGNQEILQHNFKLQALYKAEKNWRTDLKFYSLFDQAAQNDLYEDSSFQKDKAATLGISFDQSYSQDLFSLKLTGNYEQTDRNDFYREAVNTVERNSSYSELSLISTASFYLADSSIIPSLFYRYLSLDDENYDRTGKTWGAGFDINYITGDIKAYLGYSAFNNVFNSDVTRSFELSLSYNSDVFYSLVKYFSVSKNDYQGIRIYDRQIAFDGVGIILKLKLWKILFENYSHYYFDQDFGLDEYYKLQTGIYYKDMVFNENLDIKTGFEFIFNKGVEPGNLFPNIAALYDENNYRLDFTLSGEIRKAAIIYFTWENITNNNYFIIPYYPMPERNVRFGLSWELFN